MNRFALALFILISAGCSTAQYSPQGKVKSAETIESALYFAVVPAISVFKDGLWKRFEKADAPEDLILTNGWEDESYAATVTVRHGSNVKTITDLQKGSNIDGISFTKATPVMTSQENLMCVRPAMASEVTPYPRGSLFIHVMACVDTKTQIYYELTVSQQKIDDRGIVTHPSAELEVGANEFFGRFKTK